MSRSSGSVDVINSNSELLELFGGIIEDFGFNAVTFEQSMPMVEVSHVFSFFVDKEPDIIIFVIAQPYEAN